MSIINEVARSFIPQQLIPKHLFDMTNNNSKAIKKGLHSAALNPSEAINNDSDQAYMGLPPER